MPKIAKTYRTLWVNGLTLTASDTRRAFSDAYDFVNGSLGSSNFIQRLTLGASSISTQSASFSGTILSDVISEIKPMNQHTIHFMGYSDDQLCVFPGFMFINGVRCTLGARTNITASSFMLTAGGPITGNYCVLVGNGLANTFTASDIKLTLMSNISQSLAWSNDKQGYYPSIASGTRRAVYVVKHVVAGKWMDQQYLDPPWNEHFYQLANSEAVSLGFEDVNITSTLGYTTVLVNRIYAHQDKRYNYVVRGKLQTLSGSSQYIVGVSDGFPIESGFMIKGGVFLSEQDNESFPMIPQLQGVEDYVEMRSTLTNKTTISIEVSVAMSGIMSLEFGRLPENFRNSAERG